MDKKDILKRAQQEKSDERENHISLKAFGIGWMSVLVITLFLFIFRVIYNEPFNDILMIIMAQTAAGSFYQYFNIRNQKGYLITGIASTIAIFLALAALLSQYGVY